MKWLIILLLLANVQSAYAATIHGNIYDSELRAVNARVTINTTPQQLLITKEGLYSFEVPNGFYILMAQQTEEGNVAASETRNVSIRGQGDYVIDFVLFPSFEEEDDISQIPELSFPDDKQNSLLVYAFIALLVLVVIGGFYYWKMLKKNDSKNREEDIYDPKGLLDIIRKEGGRATQKDIRKQLPLSEAKISLMIAELEHKGLIEKIKKGRGNIIVLKK